MVVGRLGEDELTEKWAVNLSMDQAGLGLELAEVEEE